MYKNNKSYLGNEIQYFNAFKTKEPIRVIVQSNYPHRRQMWFWGISERDYEHYLHNNFNVAVFKIKIKNNA